MTRLIGILEPKASREMKDPDVPAKQAAAVEWCRFATAHSASVDGGKPWSFALIPHDAIIEKQTLDYLLGRFAVAPMD